MTKEQFEAYQFSTIEYDEVALGLEDAIKEGREQGREEGMEEGMEKGREEGIEKGMEIMTRKGIEKALLRKKMTIAEIAEDFEVSTQFVLEIRERLVNLKMLA